MRSEHEQGIERGQAQHSPRLAGGSGSGGLRSDTRRHGSLRSGRWRCRGGPTGAGARARCSSGRRAAASRRASCGRRWTARSRRANPALQLEIDTTPVPTGQSRDDKLFATLASGTAWDVWQRDIPPSYQQPLVDQKSVLALDEYYSSMPNLKRVLPWARSRSKLYGKTWGVPHEVEFIPVFYNKAAFAKAGIREAPKTWDAFLGLNRTLKSAGVLPMNIARGRTNPGHNFSVFLMGLIGKDGFEDLLYRDKRWDQSERRGAGGPDAGRPAAPGLDPAGLPDRRLQPGQRLPERAPRRCGATAPGRWPTSSGASGRPPASTTTSSSPRPRTPRSSPPSPGASGAASPSGRRPRTARARSPSSTS